MKQKWYLAMTLGVVTLGLTAGSSFGDPPYSTWVGNYDRVGLSSGGGTSRNQSYWNVNWDYGDDTIGLVKFDLNQYKAPAGQMTVVDNASLRFMIYPSGHSFTDGFYKTTDGWDNNTWWSGKPAMGEEVGELAVDGSWAGGSVHFVNDPRIKAYVQDEINGDGILSVYMHDVNGPPPPSHDSQTFVIAPGNAYLNMDYHFVDTSTLQGTVTLNGFSGDNTAVPITISILDPSTSAVLESHVVTLNSSGQYSMMTPLAGTYTLSAESAPNWGLQKQQNVVLSHSTPATANFTLYRTSGTVMLHSMYGVGLSNHTPDSDTRNPVYFQSNYYYGDTIGLSKFDLSSIKAQMPPGKMAVVNSASLIFLVYPNNITFTEGFYRTTDGWDNVTTYWSNKTNKGNEIATLLISSTDPITNRTWSGPQVNAYVQDELNGDGILSVYMQDVDGPPGPPSAGHTFEMRTGNAHLNVDYSFVDASTVQGTVTLYGFTDDATVVPITVSLLDPVTSVVLESHIVYLDGSGQYTMQTTRTGTYTISASSSPNWDERKVQNVVLAHGSTASASFTLYKAAGQGWIDMSAGMEISDGGNDNGTSSFAGYTFIHTNWNYGRTIGLLKFDLSSIQAPPGKSIRVNSAILKSWMVDYNYAFTDGFYKTTDNWTDQTRWADKPAQGGEVATQYFAGHDPFQWQWLQLTDPRLAGYVQSEAAGDGTLSIYVKSVETNLPDNATHTYYLYTNAPSLYVDYSYLDSATVGGKVTLYDFGGTISGTPITFQILSPTTGAVLDTQTAYLTTVNPDGSANYSFATAMPAGTYSVTAKGPHWLRQKKTGVTLSLGAAATANFDLLNGDCDNDNEVTSSDLSMVLAAMGKSSFNPGVDLDGSGGIDDTDLLLVMSYMDTQGD